ncbi:MAG: hypothetical protein WDM81_06040 [Rhizomicrobium sp.]
MSDKICVITGVGPGTGASLTRRFAAGGYRVAMLARNAERLAGLEQEIEGAKALSLRRFRSRPGREGRRRRRARTRRAGGRDP